VPVVAEVRRDDTAREPLPEGCTVLAFPSSVDEQIRVLRRSARRRPHTPR
jgi:hypothetical protein